MYQQSKFFSTPGDIPYSKKKTKKTQGVVHLRYAISSVCVFYEINILFCSISSAGN